jgi:hypothetical protein
LLQKRDENLLRHNKEEKCQLEVNSLSVFRAHLIPMGLAVAEDVTGTIG